MTIKKSIAARELKALRRVFFIYLPVIAVLYGILYLTGVVLEMRPVKNVVTTQNDTETLPIIYSDEYNIRFFGLEKFHPFDSLKYARVYEALRHGALSTRQITTAGVPDDKTINAVHTEQYLDDLRGSWTIARVTELNFLRFFPAPLARALILRPMLHQAGGTVIAAQLALDHGWAINLGGGFHHAHAALGEGFCPYADIAMAVHHLRAQNKAQKFMILDFDAHQGNGHERDFTGDDSVFIGDIYNADIYPGDEVAKKGIDLDVPIDPYTGDALYLRTVKKTLDEAFRSFRPDILFYIAGSDILEGDPLGALAVSADGLITRDEYVFAAARKNNVPIVYLFGGGYQKSNAAIIVRSLENIHGKFGIFGEAD